MDAASFEKLLEQKSLSLDTAAAQIRKACGDRRGETADGKKAEEPYAKKGTPDDAGARNNGSSGRRPFFFLVGAGISYPPIPLASSIEEDCRKLAAAETQAAESDGHRKPIDTYSYWFDQAYPHPLQRQLYLRQLIQSRTISHASFRLAHLLLDGRIANVVVTTNFDDFIARALSLFGKSYIVCDHPATVERISPEQDDIQILHVHGSYWFYDCANLRSEIADRALASMHTNRTMAYKLDDVMERSSPIVIGYSGWEEDVVMTALRRRLNSTLPYRMYWFCYQDPKPDTFPDWLVTHPQVFLVTPSAQKVEASPASAPAPAAPVSVAASAPAGADGAGDQKKRGATLGATIVLEKLIREFRLEAPQLFTDSLEFFARQLEASLPEGESGAREDNYFIKSLVAEVREINRRTSKVPGTLLRRVIQAMRRSEVHEAIELAGRINIKESKLDETQLRELMNAMRLAAAGLFENSEEELQAHDIAIAAGKKLLEKIPGDVGVRESVADAIGVKGDVLRALGRYDEALKLPAEVEKIVGDSTDVQLRRQMAKALLSRGTTYRDMKYFAGAAQKKEMEQKEAAAYRSVSARFGDSKDAGTAFYVAAAMQNEAFMKVANTKTTLHTSGKKANAAKKEIRKLYERARELAPKEPVIMVNLGYFECLTGDMEKCRELAREAIAIGGEPLTRAALELTITKPVVARDSDFAEIIKGIEMAKAAQEVGKPA